MSAPPMLNLGLDTPTRRDLEFLYVGDPMCSSCWSFTPALEDLKERYDTEPSCRAVVAMRELAPGLTLRWVARLHPAFYVEGSASRTSRYSQSCSTGSTRPARYRPTLTDPQTLELTRQDFAEAQGYGVAGFPTVL